MRKPLFFVEPRWGDLLLLPSRTRLSESFALCPAGDGPQNDWDSYLLSFNGVSSRLLAGPTTGTYLMQSDPGWLIQKITTTDGRSFARRQRFHLGHEVPRPDAR